MNTYKIDPTLVNYIAAVKTLSFGVGAEVVEIDLGGYPIDGLIDVSQSPVEWFMDLGTGLVYTLDVASMAPEPEDIGNPEDALPEGVR